MTLRDKAVAGTLVVLAGFTMHSLHADAGTHRVRGHGQHLSHRRAAELRFAADQVGKPYLYGGTGPDEFDCSGLAMMAARAGGIYVQRTSQQQFATEHQIPASELEPGDFVFFAGSDGTISAPGHMGIVKNPSRHTMYEAYATGFTIRVSHYGTPGSAPGDKVVAGYTNPFAGGA